MNGIALHGNLQQVQILHHILSGDVGAKQCIDLLRLQLQGLGGGDIVENVHHAVHHIAAGEHLHQFASPLNSRNGHHGVQILFKLAGGLGTHTQCQSGLTDGGAVEVGRLKDHGGGVRQNFGILAAHNASKTDGLGFIRNHQHTGLQVPHVAVQSGEGLALPALPDHNLAGAYIPIVKGVHGLAVFQHHIVGDVHNVVDGPYPVGTEPLAHPFGGGADFHIGNHPGGVAVAKVFCLHFHIQLVVHGAGIAALYHRLVVAHGFTEGGGSFPGKTDDGVAVGTVVGDFKIHHRVVVADDLVDVVAGLAVLLENPDAVLNGVGEIPQGQTQLLQRAEHSVGLFPPELALGDVNAPGQPGVVEGRRHQISLVDILGTGDNLHRLILPHIHLADPHMVGIFVADDGKHLAYDNILDFLVHGLIGFHLLAENGHFLHKFLVGNGGKVHKFFVNPFSVQLHPGILLRTDSGI